MAKIVVIEGIDRVGKSTLAKQLIEAGYRPIYDNVMKSGENAKEVNAAKMESIMSVLMAIADEDVKIVLDRYHLTEYVYGMADRGYNNFDKVEMIDNLLNALGAIKVYVTPSNFAKLTKCCEEHGSDLSYHVSLFNHVLSTLGYKNWQLITEHGIDEMAKLIIDGGDLNASIQ